MVEEMGCRLGRGTHFARLNCQSAFSKLDLIKTHLITEDFDMLWLSETWITKRHTDNILKINDYRLVRNDRKIQKIAEKEEMG